MSFSFFEGVQKLWMNFSTVKMLLANKNFKLFTAEGIKTKSTKNFENILIWTFIFEFISSFFFLFPSY